MLLETVKRLLTRQLQVELHPKLLKDEVIAFIDQNVKTFPGKSGIKFILSEPRLNWKVSMYTLEKSFEMNDEMAAFLEANPDMEVKVTTLEKQYKANLSNAHVWIMTYQLIWHNGLKFACLLYRYTVNNKQ